MGIAIEKKLNEAGFRMLGDNESIDMLILSILKTENMRYLKAIPYLLYKYRLDAHILYTKTTNKELFNEILSITSKIFYELNIDKRFPRYTGLNKSLENKYAKKFKLHYDEFKDEFELQLRNETAPTLFIEKQKIYAERDLQMYLSQLFTKKERHIIRRLLDEKPISRTDYEYYSRKTKKKLRSITNLYDFANNIYAKTPRYDEDLYTLKRKIEELIKKNSKDQNISVTEFYLLGDMISVGYKTEDNPYLTFAIKI
ncbi:MAG: hypothetical protein ABIH34_03670, partial [Nanoarchaeota archaeon]